MSKKNCNNNNPSSCFSLNSALLQLRDEKTSVPLVKQAQQRRTTHVFSEEAKCRDDQKQKKSCKIQHITVEGKHKSVKKPFGPSKPVTEKIPYTEENAKIYVKTDEDLEKKVDIITLQDEGLLFLTSR